MKIYYFCKFGYFILLLLLLLVLLFTFIKQLSHANELHSENNLPEQNLPNTIKSCEIRPQRQTDECSRFCCRPHFLRIYNVEQQTDQTDPNGGSGKK